MAQSRTEMQSEIQSRPEQNLKGLSGIISVSASYLLVALIKAYKLVLSPWLGQNCRFQPGCANYMMEAIQIHGPVKGVWLGVKRIGRCHPGCKAGYDPVP